MSPDTYFQVALQLAHYRDQGHVVATYETATTRAYFHGRTETVRSCTAEALKFIQALESGTSPQKTLLSLFLDACKAHQSLVKDATFGKGVDRHLLALRMQAYETGLTDVEFFTDPAYTRSTTFNLSTSNVSAG